MRLDILAFVNTLRILNTDGCSPAIKGNVTSKSRSKNVMSDTFMCRCKSKVYKYKNVYNIWQKCLNHSENSMKTKARDGKICLLWNFLDLWFSWPALEKPQMTKSLSHFPALKATELLRCHRNTNSAHRYHRDGRLCHGGLGSVLDCVQKAEMRGEPREIQHKRGTLRQRTLSTDWSQLT